MRYEACSDAHSWKICGVSCWSPCQCFAGNAADIASKTGIVRLCHRTPCANQKDQSADVLIAISPLTKPSVTACQQGKASAQQRCVSCNEHSWNNRSDYQATANCKAIFGIHFVCNTSHVFLDLILRCAEEIRSSQSNLPESGSGHCAGSTSADLLHDIGQWNGTFAPKVSCILQLGFMSCALCCHLLCF